ncbi:PAS domain-containing sensor histidine kinase [Caulobacter sp. 17J80-11]|uniref:hybrid sensor histidine kinase/response regulator n=1 Tax=Caulobacter sp. 17J80-11 TaxID=2763502 RepID=UPI001653E65E|nr:PAS domain-containing sensor histidine kinase [Caulobacter sp. 17J80-11]MBC6981264.1 PAS domain S-box protein [Caulobacter sp. 17J80-11]
MRPGRAADVTPAMMWETDAHGAVVWSNRRWADFCAGTSGVQPPWASNIHPDDLEAYVRSFSRAMREHAPLVQQYRVRRRDGTWRWVLDSAEPRQDDHGRYLGHAGAAIDVTEQRASSEAVRDSEARFHAMAEATGDVVWMADPDDGRLVYVNGRFEEVFGLARPALFDDPLFAGHAARPADADEVRTAWAAMRRGEPVELEYRHLRPDGEERIFDLTGFPVHDEHGRLRWIGGRLRDVTARRRAQTARRYSEQRFRRFAEHAEEVVALMDIETQRLEYLNPAFERVTGRKITDCLGDPGAWRKLSAPQDEDRVDRAIEAAAKGQRTEVVWHVRHSPDGEWRTVRSAKFPLKDDEGRLRWVGSLTTDITELVEAREDLERRVAERTRELETSLEQRRAAEAALAQAQRLETVGRLTGGVAHDFNNLLTVIIGALDMILRRPDQTDRINRLGQAAMEAARRGERLARQLLGFSRRQDLRTETVDLGRLIHGFEPLLRGAVGEATPLTLEIEPDVGGARLDPVQFEAALLNLAVNANDALGPGGSIRIRAERVRLAANALPEAPAGDYARVSVSDDGAGMAPEVAAHAFEPFFTTKEVGKGSGLGLAQVYGFARQSGGGAEIRSAPGQGTTVSLYLPAAEAPLQAAAPAARPIDKPLERRCHVLLVDDDPAVRGIVQSLLEDMDCVVLTASDGPSALEALKADPKVRLLLSDVVMPGMSGVELAREARRLYPHLRILLSTGYASNRLDPSEGEWEVLRKPYRAEELTQAARRALS